MSLTITPLHDTFVAAIEGTDLSSGVDDATMDEIRQAFHDNSIIVFHGQDLSNDQHVAFSRHFGELQGHTVSHWLLPSHPEILVLSNRGRGGVKPLDNGGAYWHSDITYEEVPPLGSILYALTVPPEGGNTMFADMYAAYEALDDETKEQVDGLIGIHTYKQRYLKMAEGGKRPKLSDEKMAEWTDVEHSVVLTHPETGRKALFVNEGFTVGIKGMEQAEADALLEKLFAHSTQDRFVYSHPCKAGDLVMWDNRCTMHCATPYDVEKYERTMHRTTIRGTKPV